MIHEIHLIFSSAKLSYRVVANFSTRTYSKTEFCLTGLSNLPNTQLFTTRSSGNFDDHSVFFDQISAVSKSCYSDIRELGCVGPWFRSVSSPLPLFSPVQTPHGRQHQQESHAVARKPRDAAAVLFGLKYGSIFIRIGIRKTHVFSNRVHNGPSRSSKVVDLGTNRKRVCDFLLVISSNLGPVLPRFRDIAGFVLRRATPLYSTQILGMCSLD